MGDLGTSGGALASPPTLPLNLLSLLSSDSVPLSSGLWLSLCPLRRPPLLSLPPFVSLALTAAPVCFCPPLSGTLLLSFSPLLPTLHVSTLSPAATPLPSSV